MDNVEEDFFEAFGIEKKEPCKYGVGCGHSKPCCPRELTYPPITPKIVLGLIEIILKYKNEIDFQIDLGEKYVVNTQFSWEFFEISYNGNTLKDALLYLCIHYKDEIQDQVKELFNGK